MCRVYCRHLYPILYSKVVNEVTQFSLPEMTRLETDCKTDAEDGKCRERKCVTVFWTVCTFPEKNTGAAPQGEAGTRNARRTAFVTKLSPAVQRHREAL